jgi:dUTP pyrophosphatase
MSNETPLIKILYSPGVEPLTRGSEHASGWDLVAQDDFTLLPFGRTAIPCGVRLEIPPGYEGQVRPRSGFALRFGVIAVLGTIDSDYRGEVKAILMNTSHVPYVIKRGDRIAQLVFARVEMAPIVQADELADSARGASGFGSSGK